MDLGQLKVKLWIDTAQLKEAGINVKEFAAETLKAFDKLPESLKLRAEALRAERDALNKIREELGRVASMQRELNDLTSYAGADPSLKLRAQALRAEREELNRITSAQKELNNLQSYTGATPNLKLKAEALRAERDEIERINKLQKDGGAAKRYMEEAVAIEKVRQAAKAAAVEAEALAKAKAPLWQGPSGIISTGSLGSSGASPVRRVQSESALRLSEEMKRVGNDLSKIDAQYVETGQHAEASLKKISGATSGAQKESDSFARSIRNLRWEIVGALVMFHMAENAIRGISNAFYEGAKLSEQAAALHNYAAAWGTSANEITSSIRNVSGGIVSLGEATNMANKALMLGISPEAIKSYTELSRVIARSTGEDFEKTYEKLITGSARASEKMIASTGIWVSATQANIKYAESLGVSVDGLTDFEKHQAYAKEVISQTNEVMKTQGDIALTNREKIDKAGAVITGWVEHFKERMSNAIINLPIAINPASAKSQEEVQYAIRLLEEKLATPLNQYDTDSRRKADESLLSRMRNNLKLIEERNAKEAEGALILQGYNELHNQIAATVNKNLPKEEQAIKALNEQYAKLVRTKEESIKAGDYKGSKKVDIDQDFKEIEKAKKQVIADTTNKLLEDNIKKEKEAAGERLKAIGEEKQLWAQSYISFYEYKLKLEKEHLKNLEAQRNESEEKYKKSMEETAKFREGLLTKKESINTIVSAHSGGFEPITELEQLIKLGQEWTDIVYNKEGEDQLSAIEEYVVKVSDLSEQFESVRTGAVNGFFDKTAVERLQEAQRKWQELSQLEMTRQSVEQESLKTEWLDLETAINSANDSIIIYNDNIEAFKEYNSYVETTVNVNDEQALLDINNLIAVWGELKDKTITLSVANTGIPQISGDTNLTPIEEHALGGYVSKPTISWLAEKEPEYVIPQSRIESMINSNNQQSVTVNNYNNPENRIDAAWRMRSTLGGHKVSLAR